MKKTLKYVSILIIISFVLASFMIFVRDPKNNEQEVEYEQSEETQLDEVNSEADLNDNEENIPVVSIEDNEDDELVACPNETPRDSIISESIQKYKEYEQKISNIQDDDIYNWYIQYKAINDEYADWVGEYIDIYDVFDEDELWLLFRIVETEVRDEEHFEAKVNVANVIFNRLEHNSFPSTLTGVLTQKNQFSGYKSGIYKKVSVSNMTILACEYAYISGDTTGGALYFDSTNGRSWAAKNREYMFTDEIGHNFYK